MYFAECERKCICVNNKCNIYKFQKMLQIKCYHYYMNAFFVSPNSISMLNKLYWKYYKYLHSEFIIKEICFSNNITDGNVQVYIL